MTTQQDAEKKEELQEATNEATEAETVAVEELSLEEKLTAELADTKDQLLRCIAEQDNLRKRLQKEKDDAYKYAATGFAKDMLAVIDNLERATTAANNTSTDSKNELLEGILLVQQECLNIFKKHGIEKIDAAGKAFDPNLHQAIAEVESEQENGTVVDVMQNGYVIHDRLLRPSFVSVAKKSS